jgi:outer membrane lipoprotein SlyB
MNTKMTPLLLLCGLMASSVSFAGDTGAVVGGGVGGAVGAAIGHDMNGRNGAIIGAAIGGATGAAIGTNQSRSQPEVVVRENTAVRNKVVYVRDDHRGHGKKHHRKHHGWKKGHGHNHHH